MLVSLDPDDLAALDGAIQLSRTTGPYEFCVSLGLSNQLAAGDDIEITGPAGVTTPQIWGTIRDIDGRRVAFELWRYQSTEVAQ